MTRDPVELDGQRSAAGLMGAEVRRAAHQADDTSRLADERDLEERLAATPARTWREAAERVRHLLTRYAGTADARDERRKTLIERTLSDLDRLSGQDDASR